MQTELFGTTEIKKATPGLIINRPQKQLLSKQQQAFNKLVKRIEKLRLELKQLSKSLDEKLDFYGKHIFPLEEKLMESKKQVIRLLYPFYKNGKALSKNKRYILSRILSSQLQSVFAFFPGEPENELKEIFKAVEGISYEEAAEEDFDILKFEMESMFEDMGFDVNLDDLHRNMSEEEIAKKTIEMHNHFEQQATERTQKKANHKKSKKQIEKEEKEKQLEEARSKNIGSIYKQLAKAFHPDLEQDEELKLQKEELMKQLTIAYEKNDLHTLLTLELKWIQKEENDPAQLTGSKLDIYNEVLREQVNELEREINNTLNHPRYQPLHKYISFPFDLECVNLSHEKKEIQSMTNHLQQDIEKLKGNGKQAMSTVQEIIRAFEFEMRYDNKF